MRDSSTVWGWSGLFLFAAVGCVGDDRPQGSAGASGAGGVNTAGMGGMTRGGRAGAGAENDAGAGADAGTGGAADTGGEGGAADTGGAAGEAGAIGAGGTSDTGGGAGAPGEAGAAGHAGNGHAGNGGAVNAGGTGAAAGASPSAGSSAGGLGGKGGASGTGAAGGGGVAGSGSGSGCIKVAPNGDDQAATESFGALPFRNLQPAVDYAKAAGPGRNVCVAAGASCGSVAEYPGPSVVDLRMRDGVSVHGAYESTSWSRCSDSETRLLPQTPKGVVFASDVQTATALDGFTIVAHSAPETAAITFDQAIEASVARVALRAPAAAADWYGVNAIDSVVRLEDVVVSATTLEPHTITNSAVGIRAHRSELELVNIEVELHSAARSLFALSCEACPRLIGEELRIDLRPVGALVELLQGVHATGGGGVRLSALSVQLGDPASPLEVSEARGVELSNAGSAVIDGSVQTRAARVATGLSALGTTLDFEGSANLYVDVVDGHGVGVRLEDAPGSRLRAEIEVRGRATFPPPTQPSSLAAESVRGVEVTGVSDDILIEHGSIRVKDGRSAIGLLMHDCVGAGPRIANNHALFAAGGHVGAGVVARACDATLEANSEVEGWTIGENSAYGVNCSLGSQCVIIDNHITTRLSLSAVGQSASAVGVHCAPCSRVARNRIRGLMQPLMPCRRCGIYRSTGLSLSNSDATVDANDIGGGCGNHSVGVVVSGGAPRLENNQIIGYSERDRECDWRAYVPGDPSGQFGFRSPGTGAGLRLELTAADVHSNTIHSGEFFFPECENAAVENRSAGGVLRNNLLLGGACNLGTRGVHEAMNGGPVVFRNNAFGNGFTTLYAHSAWGDQNTAAGIDALPGAFSGTLVTSTPYLLQEPADIHLTWRSPMIDRGTPEGAPAFDIDGEARGALPDIGADEWLSDSDPCAGVTCSEHGACARGVDGSLLCRCEPGFADLSNSLVCEDLDECAHNHGGCDPLAGCVNTAPGFHCADCPPGYLGSGDTTCLLDECSVNHGGCDPLTTCTNGVTHRTCGACPPGYMGTGEVGCMLASACNPNPCQNGGSCFGEAGGYRCACPPGINGHDCELVFNQLALGDSMVCGLRSDSKVTCWGSNHAGETSPPAGSFRRLAAGRLHVCGLHTDGAIQCWGYGGLGQTTVPPGTFQDVTAYLEGACGLRTNGSVTCWGDPIGGFGSWDGSWDGIFSQISLGFAFGCGLHPDGTIGCVGDDTSQRATPPVGTYSRVAARHWNACAIAAESTLSCWGASGIASGVPSGTFGQVELARDWALAMRSDGTLAVFGSSPPPPPSGTFRRIAVGASHACGVRTDHSVVCWGSSLPPPPTDQL